LAKAAKAGKLEALAAQIRVCTKCPLCQSRTLAVPGEGKASARVMLIGEAPGREEDETGHPFVGAAGRFLDHALEGTGINRNYDYWVGGSWLSPEHFMRKIRVSQSADPRRINVIG